MARSVGGPPSPEHGAPSLSRAPPAQPVHTTYVSDASSSPLVTFTHSIKEKLYKKNFLFWKQQVDPVITSHMLHRFLVNS